ncbi:MAG: hypothetical protein ACKO0Z_05650 [Betaproteobacteria bacterium]|jgi:hypothetical protein
MECRIDDQEPIAGGGHRSTVGVGSIVDCGVVVDFHTTVEDLAT